jgi:hypothetical protein
LYHWRREPVRRWTSVNELLELAKRSNRLAIKLVGKQSDLSAPPAASPK